MTAPALDVAGLTKRHGAVEIFHGVDLQVQVGECVAIMGESGVGKSTLLHCIAGLESWHAGAIRVGGVSMGDLTEAQRAQLRRRDIGFVFQAFHVLPHLDVAQNIGLPLLLNACIADIDARVGSVMAAVGLDGLGERMPAQLSGGQLQRVAIARALVHGPRLVLADEPTGNLDPGNAARVMQVLVSQARAQSAALLLVTHSQQAAAAMDRCLRMTDAGLQAA